jgi:uncharacterized protein YPO0396
MSKRSITITLDALTAGAEAIEAAVRKKQDVRDAAVEAARKELAPLVAEAKRLRGELQELHAEYGDKLQRLASIDWMALRLRRIPEDLVDPLHRKIHETQDLLIRAIRELDEVPARVARLGPADLTLKNFHATLGVTEGLHPRGPTAIQITVHLYRSAPQTVRERVAEIEYLLEQIRPRLGSAKEPLDAIPIIRPEPGDDVPVGATQADISYDPFKEG